MREQDHPGISPQEQTDRVFSNEERWYFRTREGIEMGPFRFRSEAQTGLQTFLSSLRDRLPG